MEVSREEGQTKSKEVWIYGEMTQPRSHLLKERLIMFMDQAGSLTQIPVLLSPFEFVVWRIRIQWAAQNWELLGSTFDGNVRDCVFGEALTN
jgi:hypothetical protein